ncbi:MAG: TetR/AcrR family transcriptional regulator [Chitinophagaceae bacterium]|nr:TetR/AcrR family transcriptional regulator [Chitinophagaceae bacterium]
MLQAALHLLVKNGFHGTPTSKIAAQAGVSNGTLFHYYKTKDELVIALYNEIKAEMASYLFAQINEHDNLEAKFKKSFIHSLYWALDNQEKFYYVQQFHFSPHLAKISPQVVEQQSSFHRQLITKGIQAKVLKPLPVDLLFTLVSSHVYGLYQYLSTADSVARPQAVIEQGVNLLWNMIKV